MWILRASLAACLLLGGCAAPLMMAAPGMMPKPPGCAPGASCQGDMVSELSKGFGKQFLFLPGTTAVSEQPPAK